MARQQRRMEVDETQSRHRQDTRRDQPSESHYHRSVGGKRPQPTVELIDAELLGLRERQAEVSGHLGHGRPAELHLPARRLIGACHDQDHLVTGGHNRFERRDRKLRRSEENESHAAILHVRVPPTRRLLAVRGVVPFALHVH